MFRAIFIQQRQFTFYMRIMMYEMKIPFVYNVNVFNFYSS